MTSTPAALVDQAERHAAPEAEPDSDTASRADLGWLIRLRWWAVGAQAVALLLSWQGVVQSLPPLPVLLAAAVTAITNVVAHSFRRGDRTSQVTVALLLFDATLLSSVLYFTGGAANPLSVLYLVHIALAAVILPARWAWCLTGLAVMAFGLLFFAPSLPSGAHEGEGHGGHDFHMHLRAMWMAFSLAAVLVAYFVTRVSQSLRQRERELSSAREQVQRAERVAALASLAAGTAHELGTPLGSIALAAGEMQRALATGADSALLRQDVDLIQSQAQRCRAILDAMIQEAGQTVGEAPVPVALSALIEASVAHLPAPDRARVRTQANADTPPLRVPPRAVSQAVANLLRNALAASPADGTVDLEAHVHAADLRFVIRDRGEGMSPALLRTAADPFVTTRRDAGGMGLGLFLTRVAAERLGGSLDLRSAPGRGTVATLALPRDVVHHLRTVVS